MRKTQILLFGAVLLLCMMTACVTVTMPEQSGESPSIDIALPQASEKQVTANAAESAPAEAVPSFEPSAEATPADTSSFVPHETLTPAPALTPTPAPVEPSLSGTIVSVGTSDLLLRLENGSTIDFQTSPDNLTGLHSGDMVMLWYHGEILDHPAATRVTVQQAALPSAAPQQTAAALSSVSGTVARVENSTVFVQVLSGNVFGFLLTGSTVWDGLYANTIVGDEVTVSYEGDLLAMPSAVRVVVTKAASRSSSSEADKSLVNKHLSGIVTKHSDSKVTVKTSKGKTYSFKLNSKTIYVDGESISTGCKIRVTYDGYASNTPRAKVIEVLEHPPKPHPTYKPEIDKHISGTVESLSGTWLVLTNGFVCDITKASISGTGSPGMQASITYYDKDGAARAVKVVYS